jgi:outer membrane protein
MRLTRQKINPKEQGVSHALSIFMLVFVGLMPLQNLAQASVKLTAPQIAVFQAADENERVHFMIDRAKRGQWELVSALLQRFPLQGPHAANRTLYIEGLILYDQGDLTGAVKKYRAALADDPSLNLVRSELAQTLVILDETDSAEHHLKLLEADAPSAEAAQHIRSFIDQLDAKRPLKFSGYVAVAPNTNINNGSNHDTVYTANPAFADSPKLTITQGKKKSGLGASVGGSVGYAKRLGNHWETVLAGDAGAQIYNDRNFDSVSLSQSAEMRYHLDEGYMGFGGVADESFDPNAQDLQHESLSYHSFGPRISLLYNLSQRDLFNTSAVYEWRDYEHSTYMDGTAFLSDAAWSHAVDSSLNVTLSGGFDKVNANEKTISYGTVFGGLSIYKELPFGITLNANAQARFTKFDEANLVAGYTREDQRYIGGLVVTKRDFNIYGFAPSLAYTYTRNKSNIALFDYDSHAVDLRLTKDF